MITSFVHKQEGGKGGTGMVLRRGRSAGEKFGLWTLTAFNSLLEPLMLSSHSTEPQSVGGLRQKLQAVLWVLAH